VHISKRIWIAIAVLVFSASETRAAEDWTCSYLNVPTVARSLVAVKIHIDADRLEYRSPIRSAVDYRVLQYTEAGLVAVRPVVQGPIPDAGPKWPGVDTVIITLPARIFELAVLAGPNVYEHWEGSCEKDQPQ